MKVALEYFVFTAIPARFDQGVLLDKNTPVNPTRFDSMANNGYDIDAPPLLSTLLYIIVVFTLYSSFVRYDFFLRQKFYATFYGTYTVRLYQVC